MEPLLLTKKEFLPVMQKAYLEKRLSAQGPRPQCLNRDSVGRPCIVGACLSDERVEYFDAHEGTVACLIDNKAIRFNSKEDCDFFHSLQVTHDLWAEAVGNGELSPAHHNQMRLVELLELEEEETPYV
jgi:hypothetical protein